MIIMKTCQAEDEEDNSWNKSEAEGGDGGEKKADGAASDGRSPEQNEIEVRARVSSASINYYNT